MITNFRYVNQCVGSKTFLSQTVRSICQGSYRHGSISQPIKQSLSIYGWHRRGESFFSTTVGKDCEANGYQSKSLVQEPAPDFTANAVLENNTIQELRLSDFKGRFVILLFYPLDFTFVCPSELLAFSDRISEFHQKECEVISISVDSHFCHLAWKKTPLKDGGIGKIKFPMVSDISKKISRDYGVLVKDNTVSLRGLFLLDKEGIIRHSVVNDLPLGRSVDEALRMIDAYQHFQRVGEVCPADWRKGDKGMTPTAAGVAEYLSNKAK